MSARDLLAKLHNYTAKLPSDILGEYYDETELCQWVTEYLGRPEPTDTRTLSDLAMEAINVQNACNAVGLALGYHKALIRLRELTKLDGDKLPKHPISKLWVDKLIDLSGGTGMQSGEYSRVYQTCKDMAVAGKWVIRTFYSIQNPGHQTESGYNYVDRIGRLVVDPHEAHLFDSKEEASKVMTQWAGDKCPPWVTAVTVVKL